MRKITAVLCIIMMVFAFSACGNSEQAEDVSAIGLVKFSFETTPEPVLNSTGVPEMTPVPQEEGAPNQLGFYIKDKEAGIRTRIQDTYTSQWVSGEDIACFEVLATNEKTASMDWYADVWNQYWENYPLANRYKVGYVLEVTFISGEIKTQRILGPDDTKAFWDNVEIYLYDDVHQVQGQRYTHLFDYDITDETLCTSIKLTPGVSITQVASMKLTAFTYRDLSEFDQTTGEYLGSNQCSFLLKDG